MTSISTVFGSYELLEQILLCLPLRSLLLAQGVNKACHDVITGSLTIQRALWLKPSSGDTLEWYPQKGPRKRIRFQQSYCPEVCSEWRPSSAGPAYRPLVNPFADIREDESNDAFHQGHFKAYFERPWRDIKKLNAPDGHSIDTHLPGRPAKSGDQRSLRRMLLTHPPARRIGADNMTYARDDSFRNRKAVVVSDEGILMDDFLGELSSCQQQKGRGHFKLEGGQSWFVLSGQSIG